MVLIETDDHPFNETFGDLIKLEIVEAEPISEAEILSICVFQEKEYQKHGKLIGELQKPLFMEMIHLRMRKSIKKYLRDEHCIILMVGANDE